MFRLKRKHLLVFAVVIVTIFAIGLAIRPKHYYYGRILSYAELQQWPQGRHLGCTHLAGTLFDSICFDTEEEVTKEIKSALITGHVAHLTTTAVDDCYGIVLGVFLK